PQVCSFGDFDTQDNGKMPLALSLSPLPGLYRKGSEWAVGNSNSAKLIHFLKNAQFFMRFSSEVLHVLRHTATSRCKVNTDWGIGQEGDEFKLVHGRKKMAQDSLGRPEL
ncbi:MAG: hypothetical protein K2H38_03955, partial [Muribaculaceae bacterium]|nr:hypothetical protein [Muribaculaceae bacterium]